MEGLVARMAQERFTYYTWALLLASEPHRRENSTSHATEDMFVWSVGPCWRGFLQGEPFQAGRSSLTQTAFHNRPTWYDASIVAKSANE